MLYRALTGQSPFESEDFGEVLSLVLTQEPPRPRSLEPSITEALELVIQKAMAKDPADRYQSMEALDSDLAAFDVEIKTSLAPPPISSVHVSEAAVRAHAPTVLQLQTKTMDAKLARPMLLLLSVAAFLWGVACLVDGLGSALALFRGQRASITLTEKAIIALTAVAASVTPAIFWGRQLTAIWNNSVRTMEASKLLRKLMLAALIPYAAIALTLRLFDRVRSHGWNVSMILASILVAFAVYAFSRYLDRRRSR